MYPPSMYIARLGNVMAAVFCIDRSGLTSDHLVNNMVATARRMLAEIVAGMLMDQLDVSYSGGVGRESVDRAIDAIIQDASNILAQVVSISNEGEKFKKCRDYLNMSVGTAPLVQ